MCLAVPMRVIEITGDPDDFLNKQAAQVESEGIEKEIRLDVVDHWPAVGDYVIIHAGFAIHTLSPEEAERNLELMREMARGLDEMTEGGN
ncbi:MAG: HypC/HybG/HupF family hydrogenase formation chaperone [Thermodesulfobacteriota bacterium]